MRDPRVNPRPGDVLRKGESVVEMIKCDRGNYQFRFAGIMRDCPRMHSWDDDWLAEFRKWASDAEVVNA